MASTGISSGLNSGSSPATVSVGGGPGQSLAQYNAPATTPKVTSSGIENISPTVVSPSAAVNNLNTIRTDNSNIQTGIANQAQTNSTREPSFSTGDVKNFIDSYQKYQSKNTGTSSSPLSSDQILDAFNKANNLSSSSNSSSSTSDSTYKIDSNGNAIDQNGQNVGTVDDSGNITDYNGKNVGTIDSKTLDSYVQSQISTEMGNKTSAYQDYISQMNSLKNGAIPLTSTEQALVDSTNQSFQRQEDSQALANKNYEGGTAVLNARTGLDRYAPEIAQQNIANAVQYGISKIADIDSKRVEAVAKLQQGFDDQNYKLITDSYNAYKDLSNDKLSELNTLHSTIYNQEKDQAAATQAAAQQAETERHNTATEEAAAAGTYSVVNNPDGTQSIFNNKTGEVEGTPGTSISPGDGVPGNTGIPILDSNTKTSNSGIPYIDGTNMTGKVGQQAQLDAAKAGIPYMGKTQAAALQKLDDAKNNIASISSDIMSFLPKDAEGRATTGALGNKLGQLLQTNGDLASFNTWRSAAIGILQALAGGSGSGLRINSAEIALSVQNDIPNITDTVATAQGKIAKVNSMIANAEKSLFGESVYNKFNPTSDVDNLKTYYTASPDHASQVDSIRSQFPNMTPGQVMQLVQSS